MVSEALSWPDALVLCVVSVCGMATVAFLRWMNGRG